MSPPRHPKLGDCRRLCGTAATQQRGVLFLRITIASAGCWHCSRLEYGRLYVDWASIMTCRLNHLCTEAIPCPALVAVLGLDIFCFCNHDWHGITMQPTHITETHFLTKDHHIGDEIVLNWSLDTCACRLRFRMRQCVYVFSGCGCDCDCGCRGTARMGSILCDRAAKKGWCVGAVVRKSWIVSFIVVVARRWHFPYMFSLFCPCASPGTTITQFTICPVIHLQDGRFLVVSHEVAVEQCADFSQARAVSVQPQG